MMQPATAATMTHAPHPASQPRQSANRAVANGNKVKIPLNKLSSWDGNPRKNRTEDSITALADSIEANGLIHALRVFSPSKDAPNAVYIGETRYLAHLELAKRGTIAADHLVDCIFDDISEDTARLKAVAENIARAGFEPIEQAEAIAALTASHKSVYEIAKAIGVSKADVMAAASIAHLSEAAKNLVRSKERPYNWLVVFTTATPTQQERILTQIAQSPQSFANVDQLRAEIRTNRILAKHALFDVENSGLPTVTDLLGTEVWIIDKNGFFEFQTAAIEEIKVRLIAEGQSRISVLSPGQFFRSSTYQVDKTSPYRETIIEQLADGEVRIHKDLVSNDAHSLASELHSLATNEDLYTSRTTNASLEGRVNSPTIKPPSSGDAAETLAKVTTKAVVARLQADPVLALRTLVIALFENTEIRSVSKSQKFETQTKAEANILKTLGHDSDQCPTLDELPEDLDDLTSLLARLVPTILPIFKIRKAPFKSINDVSLARRLAAPSAADIRHQWTPDAEFLDHLTLPEGRCLLTEFFGTEGEVNPDKMTKKQIVNYLANAFSSARDGTFLFAPEIAAQINAWVPEYLVQEAA